MAIGTITGGFIHGPAPKGPGAPVATGNFIYADGALGATLNVTVTMTEPVSYVGFAWGTSDYSNKVDVYKGTRRRVPALPQAREALRPKSVEIAGGP
jgi:hypothetical protein